MNIGYKLYEDLRDTQPEEFERLQLEMALTCEANGWCMEDGYDGDRRYLIINPPVEPTLDELKTAKLADFKNQRDRLEVEPIEYNGNSFDYDEKARDRINAAIIALDMQTQLTGKEASLSWTTADNTEAVVTANDLRGVIATVAVRSNALHVKYRELKELVEAAETAEDLEAIVW